MKQTSYILEDILENEKGWLFYDTNLKLFRKIINSIDGNNMIDIGCGGGILTEALAKKHQMTGIDIDSDLIKVAQSRENEHIKYLNVTSDDLCSEHHAAFDFITCLEVLEHVDNPAAIVSDISKMLKPNGYAFFSTLNRNPISFLGAKYCYLKKLLQIPLLYVHRHHQRVQTCLNF